jgi:hypothetical protein
MYCADEEERYPKMGVVQYVWMVIYECGNLLIKVELNLDSFALQGT